MHSTTRLGTSTRRDFLKQSSLTAGAGVLASVPLARFAHAAGSDVLRVGLVGCGGRGTGAALNAMAADKQVKVVALADSFEDRAQGCRKTLQQQKPEQTAIKDDHVFVGFEAYKQLIQSDVDVVLLCETPHFRPMHLRAAIDAGKHVFCEKPVAVDAPGIRSILETCKLAEQKGLSIVSGLCWRYHPAVIETMKRIHDGAIGEI
ncbi:MAG TPA: Gfo/Idh/MocA family oxidoreductase, partial [Thermoguttaceae bacterium]|nr:Gfo/Idh/MocA family oxidoreductase [Thermoguttaceae bacterium]